METKPLNWMVYRRYSDFDWLRNTLIKFYPGFYVPPIPSKKLGLRRLEKDYVYKRMKLLNHFINCVCLNEEFKASEVLNIFLSCTNRGRFEEKMKEFSSAPHILDIDNIKNIEGKVYLSNDDSSKKYFVNIEKYFLYETQILQKVNFNVKSFISNLYEACNNLNSLSKNFELLKLLNSKVMMKEEITKTFDELQNFTENWEKILKKQIYSVQVNFKDFFKILKLEGNSFLNLMESRTQLENKFNSELIKIAIKKDRLFNTKDLSKFEIAPGSPVYDSKRILVDKQYAFSLMCTKDNIALFEKEKFLRYFNEQIIFQLKLLVNQYKKRYIENFVKFDELFYPSLNDVYYYM